MHLEKRSNQRIDFGILVHHNHKRRMTRDLSSEGCFIKKRSWDRDMELLPIGSEIDLSFEFINTDDYIDVVGQVVHHGEEEDGLGIWFKRINERDMEFIRGFVRNYSL